LDRRREVAPVALSVGFLGDSHAYRDFDSLGDLVGVLQRAGLYGDVNAISSPDPQASSVVLSQAVEVSDSELSSLGLKYSP
jgi:hypothetical protein